ncbi:MAG: cytochrome c biogenesis protein ResB [Nitrospirae bacterium]|nr:cytochrome c biogenesis protein ResB [Nitrospirota bacterium]
MKGIIHFFLSIRTSLWLLWLLLGILFYGSFIMPLNEEFQALHTVALLPWLMGNSLSITWWLWLSIGILVFLTVNTLFCSIESVLRKRGSRHWLLVISPQVIHTGFLFILLAHLLSSYGSFRGTAFVAEGTTLNLPNGQSVLFEKINAQIDSSGYVRDWSSDITYFSGEKIISKDTIMPNSPSFKSGFGIYIKTVQFEPFSSALIEVSREPGAPWALAGGVLFIIGMTTLLIMKIRREEASGRDEL